MVKLLSLLFISCFLLTCSSTRKTHLFHSKVINHLEVASVEEKFFILLEFDLLWLKNLDLKLPPKFKKYSHSYFELIQKTEKIIIADGQCASGLMACSYPDKKNTIYLDPKIFKFSSEQRVSTLLHEQMHHLTNFHHTFCKKRPSWGYECDSELVSAYGLEYSFYQSLNAIGKLKMKRLLKHSAMRINSL